MKENKTSDAQIRANRRWEEKNKKKSKVDTYRRMARLFIRNYAEDEDVEELIAIYQEENKNLKKD